MILSGEDDDVNLAAMTLAKDESESESGAGAGLGIAVAEGLCNEKIH